MPPRNQQSSSFLTAFRFAIRESRGGISSMRLMLLSLVLGVAVITGVLVLRDALFAGIENDAKRVLGGDIVLSRPYKPATADETAIIGQYGYISQIAEMRSMAIAGSGDSQHRRLVELKGVDDAYPLYGEVELEPYMPIGDALKGNGAVVDESVIELLKIKVGDEITVGNAKVKINAAIKREPDHVVYTYQLGPRVMVSRSTLESTGLLVPGSVVNYHSRIRLKQGVASEGTKTKLTSEIAGHGWRITDYKDATPRLKDMLGNLQHYVSIVALAVLLTAGMGIAISVKSWLSKRQQTIAVFKCLGATSNTVGIMYGFLLLAATLIAAMVGVSAGYFLPRLIIPMLGNMLPVDPVWDVSLNVLLTVPAFALTLVAAFGFWPLAEAIAIRPAQVFRSANIIESASISNRIGQIFAVVVLVVLLIGLAALITGAPLLTLNFSAGMLAAFGLLFFLSLGIKTFAGIAGSKMSLIGRYAMSGMTRIGAPTTAMMLSIGIGTALLVAVLLVEHNMTRQLSTATPEDAPSFFFLDVPSDKQDSFKQMITGMDGVSSYNDMAVMRGRISSIKGSKIQNAEISPEVEWAAQGDRVIAFSDEKPASGVVEGNWWPKGETRPLVSITSDIAEGMGLKKGDKISFDIMGNNVDVEIANIREVDWKSFKMNFAFILPTDMLGDRPFSYMATVKTSIAAEANVMRVAGDNYPSVAVVRLREALQDANSIVSSIGGVIEAVAAFAILMGALVMISAVGASLQQRSLDNALLKVLGATRGLIVKMISVEFMVIGISSAVVASMLGMVGAWMVVHFVLGSKFYLSTAIMLFTSVLSVLAIMIAGIAISWNSLRVKPLNVLRNE